MGFVCRAVDLIYRTSKVYLKVAAQIFFDFVIIYNTMSAVLDMMPKDVVALFDLLKEKVPADAMYLILGLWIIRCLYSVLDFIYDHTLKSPKNLKRSYGEWAVVTGATDGIGLAMCKEFAKNGMNVVLMSRTLSKLEDKANEISEKYPNIEVKYMQVDFSKINQVGVRNGIDNFLSELNVGVLVNNVGVSYPFPKYFNELTDSEVTALTTLNVDATTWMIRLVLDGMIERKKGAIINISSAAGVLTSPLLAQYGAAKGYVAQMSRALHYELKSKGIYVQCQVPLYVTTKLAKIKKASLFVATEAQYVPCIIGVFRRL